jgi:hypothetical protein
VVRRIALWLGILALLARMADASAAPPLVDGWETVVLTPRQLPELNGAAIDHLRLFAFSDRFRPIPFQIDEVDSEGRYLLPDGPVGQSLHHRFERADELVFLARSLGRKAPEGTEPPCPGARALPVGREGEAVPLGWVYAATCAPSTPRAREDWTRYDPRTGLAETIDYRLHFNAGLPLAPDRLRFSPDQGGDGRDLLRGIYVEGQVQLLGGLLRFTRMLKDFRAEVAAFSDGPVRVIRRTPARARTIGDNYTNPGTFTVESVLEPGHLSFEVVLKTTHDISAYLHDLLLTVAWDFQQFGGMRMRFPNTNVVGMADGHQSRDEAGLAGVDAPWIYASGPQGAFIGRMTYAARLPVIKRLYFVDGEGGQLLLGYRLSNLQRLAKGSSVFRVEILNLNRGSYEEAKAVIDARRRRLTRLSAG